MFCQHVPHACLLYTKDRRGCRIIWKWNQGVLRVSTEFFKLNPEPGQEEQVLLITVQCLHPWFFVYLCLYVCLYVLFYFLHFHSNKHFPSLPSFHFLPHSLPLHPHSLSVLLNCFPSDRQASHGYLSDELVIHL